MPSSAFSTASQTTNVLAAAALTSRQPPALAHFGVMPFRRDATGTIVPGVPVEVPNCDIAWRRARAEAFDHDNVGAVVVNGSDLVDAGGFKNGVLLALFGELALDTLTR